MDLRWNSLGRPDWDRLTGEAGVAFQQHWAYGAACEALGSRVLRAEFRAGGRTVALAQIVTRRLLGLFHAAVLTRGPVWVGATGPDLRAEALRLLVRALPLPRLRGLFVTPDAAGEEAPVLAAAGLARVMTPYATAELDLTQSAAELRAGLHGKWRNRLVTAEKAGLVVRRAGRTAADRRWLEEIEAGQQRRRRYAALPPALVEGWAMAGKRDPGLLLLVAEGEGARMGAMLFLRHGRRATYHIGWTAEAGRAAMAGNLLLWQAMLALKADGVETLDLGGLNTVDLPGIARFKLGTGARPRILCGTWFGA